MQNFDINFTNPLNFSESEYEKYYPSTDPQNKSYWEPIQIMIKKVTEEENNYSPTPIDYANLVKEDLANQTTFHIYPNQIKEKLAFLSSKAFKSLSAEAKAEWFWQNLNDLNAYQEQHFKFLVDHFTNLIKTRFQVFFSVLDCIFTMGVFSGKEDDDDTVDYFELMLDGLDNNLKKLAIVMDTYNQLNQQESLLRKLVNNFKRNYSATFNKENKKNKDLLKIMILPEYLNWIQDQKDAILLKEKSHQTNFKVLTCQGKAWSKLTMLIHIQPKLIDFLETVRETSSKDTLPKILQEKAESMKEIYSEDTLAKPLKKKAEPMPKKKIGGMAKSGQNKKQNSAGGLEKKKKAKQMPKKKIR